MNETCDLCSKSILPGEPRRGGLGDGGKSGAPFGFGRHWKCHIDKFGSPGSTLWPDKRPAGNAGLTPAKAPPSPRSVFYGRR